jgi:uncharacterized caspase-like protein
MDEKEAKIRAALPGHPGVSQEYNLFSVEAMRHVLGLLDEARSEVLRRTVETQAALVTMRAAKSLSTVDVCSPQPPPMQGKAPSSADLVILDVRTRKEMGHAKYGVVHSYDNQRDHLVDAFQEALDQAIYLRAEIERRRNIRKEAADKVRAYFQQSKDATPELKLSAEILARSIEEET